MMYCPRCGYQQEDARRFCSRCGQSLSAFSDALFTDEGGLEREKRQVRGIALIITTAIILFSNIVIYGVATLPHLPDSNRNIFFWTWLLFVATSIIIGGWSLNDLLRSGFFRTIKERQMRLLLEQSRNRNEAGTSGGNKTIPQLPQPISITEATTSILTDRFEVTERIESDKA